MYRGVFLGLLLVAACARGEITLPAQDAATRVTLDAATAWTYVELFSGSGVAPTSPATSSAWDIGFQGTNAKLNGGANGPGGIVGYCLCQNGSATDQQVLGFTSDNQQAAFDNITSADEPPASDAWTADVFSLHPWYRTGIGGNAHVYPTFSVYLIRRGDVLYKLQVTSYYGAGGETSRISIRYAKVR